MQRPLRSVAVHPRDATDVADLTRRVRAALDGIAGVLFLGFALRLLLTDRKFA